MGALRVFKREQFLFLRFEDLMRMKAPALLRLISNFTGEPSPPAAARRRLPLPCRRPAAALPSPFTHPDCRQMSLPRRRPRPPPPPPPPPAGLYTDDTIISRLRGNRRCEAGVRGVKKPLSFTAPPKDNNSGAFNARRELRELLPELEAFYKPYNDILGKLVHPAFQWGPETHRVEGA